MRGSERFFDPACWRLTRVRGWCGERNGGNLTMSAAVNWRVCLLSFCLLASAIIIYPTYIYEAPRGVSTHNINGHRISLPIRDRAFLFRNNYPGLRCKLEIEQTVLELLLASVLSLGVGVLARKNNDSLGCQPAGASKTN
jgi:hypothetical protein